MSFIVKKVLEVPNSPHLNCLSWSKKQGYLAYIDCDKVKAARLKPMWEGKFPCPEHYCGGGDKEKDPRCAVSAPGCKHPHDIMIGDVFYTLHIDI